MAIAPPIPALPPIYPGQEITLLATFNYRNETRDPSTITFGVRKPNAGSSTFYSYGSPGTPPVVRMDVGIYQISFVVDVPGIWYVSIASTGIPTTTYETSFPVLISRT